MNWKRHFQDVILERGYDYYKRGAVEITHSDNEFIDASIKEYSLRIRFSGDDIKSMYCSCPYEGNCKHLAATLYYADEHPDIICEENVQLIPDDISCSDLRRFLSGELSASRELLNRFRLFTGQDIDEEFYIEKLIKSAENPYDVYKFMDDDIPLLISAKHFDLIFRLCDILICYIEELRYEHMWDAYDNIYDMTESLFSRLIEEGCAVRLKEFILKVIDSTEDESLCDGFSYFLEENGLD